MKFFYAHLTTGHYSFDAFGVTEGDARKALRTTIGIHCDQTQISRRDFMKEFGDSISVRSVAMNVGFRDGEEVR